MLMAEKLTEESSSNVRRNFFSISLSFPSQQEEEEDRRNPSFN